MKIWSHRGRSSTLEIGNSHSSFINIYHLGIHGIETDISFTKDKKIIIYHPGSNKPDLSDMTWEEIKKSIFNVMDLYSFLRLLKAFKGTYCCLDIKQNSKELVQQAIEIVLQQKMQDKIYFTAFQKRIPYPPLNLETGGEILLYAKELSPEIKTHLLVTFPFNLLKIIDKYNPDAISFGWLSNNMTSIVFYKSMIKPWINLKSQIIEVQKRGIEVWGGIVNDEKGVKYFCELGVDAIMTDDPQFVLNTIARC